MVSKIKVKELTTSSAVGNAAIGGSKMRPTTVRVTCLERKSARWLAEIQPVLNLRIILVSPVVSLS